MKAGDEQNSGWLPKDHVFSSARNGVQLWKEVKRKRGTERGGEEQWKGRKGN